MSYENRNKVREIARQDVNYIMSLFPNDYSTSTIKLLRNEIEGKIFKLLSEYNNAFCQDNDLCPTCISGGYQCDSDHK